ncbi:hypothetical protein [Marinilactibacillus psychrotolerans]|uniref:Uncharacterized protein n=1 Tax=Marinilactibacillus psychrotolerans 42ea TaxID=1255609 RepID=A0A1R4K335_9LACT|nr:hypothetical protein [Marinilactibacillus psychrotolerans]SJN38433.1 hypothetical protein FM115_07845 [Marinilactibacillus psychrotolerans 42ea]
MTLIIVVGFEILHVTYKKDLQKLNIAFAIFMIVFALANLLQVLT